MAEQVGNVTNQAVAVAAETGVLCAPLEQQKDPAARIVNVKSPKIGILRLDYIYETSVGEVSNPGTFEYGVRYERVKGLTFDMLQKGKPLPKDIMDNMKEKIKSFDEQSSIVGISGSCGFFIHYQSQIRELTDKPVFLSSIMFAPLIESSLKSNQVTLVLTANSDTMNDQVLRDLLESELEMPESKAKKFCVVGFQDIPGFGDEVHCGIPVKFDKAKKPMMDAVKKKIQEMWDDQGLMVGSLLLECTQLPPFTNCLIKETNLPVFDIVGLINTFHSASSMSLRYGTQ